MAEQSTATEVLARVDTERAEWETLMAEIGEERMETPGASGEWSVKDVIVHLSDWKRPYLDSFQAAIEGTTEPPSDWPIPYNEADGNDEKVEVVNSWLYERSRDRPVDEVITESRGQWDELRGIVAEISEERLNDPDFFPRLPEVSLADAILGGGWFNHFHEEHEPMLREWLQEERLR